MTSTEFEMAGKRIFGQSGWKGQLADALCISRTTVWRYVTGVRPIPQSVCLAMETLKEMRR